MENKTCSKCQTEFPATTKYFQKSSKSKNGVGSYCKSCQKEHRKNYYQNNKNQENERNKSYYYANKTHIIKRLNNWYKKNKTRISKRSTNYRKIRRRQDVSFRIKCNLRNRLNKVLRGKNKSQSTMELLGCSIENFKLHIENKFQQGMNWENYGRWHIDHIRPCASFDLNDISQQKECFHYTNLQPLWAIDNIRKSDSWVSGPIEF